MREPAENPGLVVSRTLMRLFALRSLDMNRSRWSRGESPSAWMGQVYSEYNEMCREWIPKSPEQMEAFLDGTGDFLGDVISMLLSLANLGIDLERAVDLAVEKFQKRKPWVSPDYQGLVPATAEEENRLWIAAKAEKEVL